MTEEPLTVGEKAMDTARNKIGTFMGTLGSLHYLRPLGGGTEWTTSEEYVRRATTTEVVAAKLDAHNKERVPR